MMASGVDILVDWLNVPEELSVTKVEMIKKAIKDKTYDWEAAIKGAAERILEHPESLLWG